MDQNYACIIGSCFIVLFNNNKKAYSIRPSVCPSFTRVHQSKTVEVRILQFSPYSVPLVLQDKFHPETLTGSPELGRQTKGGVGKTSYFLALNVNNSKTAGDTSKFTVND